MFTAKQRDNGDSFYTLSDKAPEWLKEAVQEAHDGMLPDDYIFEWCTEAYHAYEDYNGNLDSAISDIEAEPYYNALNVWFSSRMARAELVDEMLQELDCKEVYTAIAWAQVREKERVYRVIFEAIEENKL